MDTETKFFHPETPETPAHWPRFPGAKADLRIEGDVISIGPDLNLTVERVTKQDIIARHNPRTLEEAAQKFTVGERYTINGEQFRLRRITGELLIFRPLNQARLKAERKPQLKTPLSRGLKAKQKAQAARAAKKKGA